MAAEGVAVVDGAAGYNRPLRTEIFETRPDLEGNFRFNDLPSRSRIYLAAEGHGLGQAQFMSEEPRELRQVSLRLEPEGVIEGTLTYQETGEPAVGVSIFAFPLGRFTVRAPFETEVDEAGRFRFTGLPTEVFNLSTYEFSKESEWVMAIRGPVQVAAGQSVGGMDLDLERGAVVSGLVSDAVTGARLPDAAVAAVGGPQNGSIQIGVATTDVDGRYALRLPTGRSKLYLQGIPAGYARPPASGETVVDVAPGQTLKEGVDFRLAPSEEQVAAYEYEKVHGRVLGPEGQPVEQEGIGVTVIEHGEVKIGDPMDRRLLLNQNQRTWTDGDGRYELSLIAGFRYQVRAGGGEFAALSSQEFLLQAGQAHAVEDLILRRNESFRRGESFIEGAVVDPEGHPIVGAEINASGKSKAGDHFGEEQRTGPGSGELRMVLKIVVGANPEQGVKDSRVSEVDLRGFYLALRDVFEPGLQLTHHERAGEYVQVASYCGIRNAQ